MCKALSWSQHTWVCPYLSLVGKNLESKQTGARGSRGIQKEMSHLNSQSRAVAELGAEPGPAAQILGRILIFNFPVAPFHPSCLSDLPSISLGKPGVISTCCFFTPVKWYFLPFISFQLLSTHLPVYSESQVCLQHNSVEEKTGQNPSMKHEGMEKCAVLNWSDSNRNSRSGSVHISPSVNPSLRKQQPATGFSLKNQDFFQGHLQLSAPKLLNLYRRSPQNQLLKLECLRQKSVQAMTRDWLTPMWFWSISSFPKSTKNPPGCTLGDGSPVLGQFDSWQTAGGWGGNGWGIKSPFELCSAPVLVPRNGGGSSSSWLFLIPFWNSREKPPDLGPISKGAGILHPLPFQILRHFMWKLLILHKVLGEREEKQLSWKSVQKSCTTVQYSWSLPNPWSRLTTPQILTTKWISLLPQAPQSQVSTTWEKLKPQHPALLKLNFTPATKSNFSNLEKLKPLHPTLNFTPPTGTIKSDFSQLGKAQVTSTQHCSFCEEWENSGSSQELRADILCPLCASNHILWPLCTWEQSFGTKRFWH